MTSITLSMILLTSAIVFSQISTPTYAADIDPLQGVYQFDEKTGTTAFDGVGHIGNGELVNMNVSAARILGGTDAAFSGALELNADDSDDRVRINPVGAFPTTALTVEFWIKTEDDLNAVPVSYAAGSGVDANIFTIEGVDIPRIWINGTFTADSTASFNDGEWHHIAVTWDGDCAGSADGKVRLYQNGALNFTSDPIQCNTSLNSTGSLVFGQDQDSLDGTFQAIQACNCTMDEIRIWDEALDAEAIAESANLGEARNTDEFDTELGHDSFASVIVWTSAFHDVEDETVPWRMMRVDTNAEIDNSTSSDIDCDKINPNPKKDPCPGGPEQDGINDGIFFRGLSPKGTILDILNPDESTIAACDLAACSTDLIEEDIFVGDFTNPPKPTKRPASAHFSVATNSTEPLGSNAHRH